MTKKAKKAETETPVSLMQWAEPSTHMGTPSLVIMPPKNYYFKVLKGEHKISIPRKGTYYDIDPDFFSKEDGEFNLYDEDNKIMYLPAISKVLFATKKYPDLEYNQLFAPIALVFNIDEVVILGQVLEMMPIVESSIENN